MIVPGSDNESDARALSTPSHGPVLEVDESNLTGNECIARSSGFTNAALIGLSLILSLFIAEIGFRVVAGMPLFELRDWRKERLRLKRIGDRADLDPVLGWRLKPNFAVDEFSTIAHGIRRNFEENHVRTGSILAVGDSFTEGFGVVADFETWPAHLETLIKRPVVNGGVSGYAADQTILRAEQLIPLVKPKTLIMGLTEVGIERMIWSDGGAPKPYLTLENDRLIHHPPKPIEAHTNREDPLGTAIRTALGRSALADHIFSRLTYNFWYPQASTSVVGDEYDAQAVFCRLLKRLKTKTDAQKIDLLLFLQYGAYFLLEQRPRPEDMTGVTRCADRLGIRLVDQLTPLKTITKGSPSLVAQYYADEGGELGHMSSKGNSHAAQLLFNALTDQVTATGAVLSSNSNKKRSID